MISGVARGGDSRLAPLPPPPPPVKPRFTGLNLGGNLVQIILYPFISGGDPEVQTPPLGGGGGCRLSPFVPSSPPPWYIFFLRQ